MQKKITKATVKTFLKKNDGKLFIRFTSSFDGMCDSVMAITNPVFVPVVGQYNPIAYHYGIGVKILSSSPNYFAPYEDSLYTGYRVDNCVGGFEVVILK